jgi:hypothetical protein
LSTGTKAPQSPRLFCAVRRRRPLRSRPLRQDSSSRACSRRRAPQTSKPRVLRADRRPKAPLTELGRTRKRGTRVVRRRFRRGRSRCARRKEWSTRRRSARSSEGPPAVLRVLRRARPPFSSPRFARHRARPSCKSVSSRGGCRVVHRALRLRDPCRHAFELSRNRREPLHDQRIVARHYVLR